jgi:hypothetical protein
MAGEEVVAARRVHSAAAGLADRVEGLLKCGGVVRLAVADGPELADVNGVDRRRLRRMLSACGDTEQEQPCENRDVW